MSLQNDIQLTALIESGELIVDPFDPASLGPVSIDLKLGDLLVRYPEQVIDLGRRIPTSEKICIGEQGYVLSPGEFVLGMTMEHVKIPLGYHGSIETKGDIARAGIQIHSNDGHIDPGSDGHITLEISNLHRDRVAIRLHAGISICQLFLVELAGPVGRPYEGKYSHQKEPTTYLP